MITMPGDQANGAVRALFDGASLPAGVRCCAVLDGYFPGTVHTDDAEHPTWAVLHESVYGTLYPAGAVTKDTLTALVKDYRSRGEALIGCWPGDPIRAVLPDSPQYEGAVLEFTERAGSLADRLRTVPQGCELRRMDASLLKRSRNYEELIKTYGSIDVAAQKEIPFCLMRGDTIVSEATAGPLSPSIMEVGMVTHEDFRGRGYATFVCATVIDACEQQGFVTYWNCNADNTPSAIIARKLGYQTERRYSLAAWWPEDVYQ